MSNLNVPKFADRLVHFICSIEPERQRKIPKKLWDTLKEATSNKQQCQLLLAALEELNVADGILIAKMVYEDDDSAKMLVITRRNCEHEYVCSINLADALPYACQTHRALNSLEADACLGATIAQYCRKLIDNNAEFTVSSLLAATLGRPNIDTLLTQSQIININQLIQLKGDQYKNSCVYKRKNGMCSELVIAKVKGSNPAICSSIAFQLPTNIQDSYLFKNTAYHEAYPAFMYEPISTELTIQEDMIDLVDEAVAAREIQQFIKILDIPHELENRSEAEFAVSFSGISMLLHLRYSSNAGEEIDEAIYDRLRAKLTNNACGIVLHTNATSIELIPGGMPAKQVKHYNVLRKHTADGVPTISIAQLTRKEPLAEQPEIDAFIKQQAAKLSMPFTPTISRDRDYITEIAQKCISAIWTNDLVPELRHSLVRIKAELKAHYGMSLRQYLISRLSFISSLLMQAPLSKPTEIISMYLTSNDMVVTSSRIDTALDKFVCDKVIIDLERLTAAKDIFSTYADESMTCGPGYIYELPNVVTNYNNAEIERISVMGAKSDTKQFKQFVQSYGEINASAVAFARVYPCINMLIKTAMNGDTHARLLLLRACAIPECQITLMVNGQAIYLGKDNRDKSNIYNVTYDTKDNMRMIHITPVQQPGTSNDPWLDTIADKYASVLSNLQIEPSATGHTRWEQQMLSDAKLNAIAKAALELRDVYEELIQYVATCEDVGIPVMRIADFIRRLNQNGLPVSETISVTSGSYGQMGFRSSTIYVVKITTNMHGILIQIPILPSSLIGGWARDIAPLTTDRWTSAPSFGSFGSTMGAPNSDLLNQWFKMHTNL